MTQTTEERFFACVEEREGACWLWMGPTNDAGYGRFSCGSGRVRAHRWVYERFIGPIPPNMTVDHLCHNADDGCSGGTTCPHRRCVNPDHLEVVPRSVNVLRGKGRSAENARKTLCSRGHELADDNLYVSPAGKRYCRKCNSAAERARPKRDQRAYLRAYRARKRAEREGASS